MPNDYLAVFLYRWDDATPQNDGGSTVAFGEWRKSKQHRTGSIIGVATRPVGETINHHSSTPAYEAETRSEFVDHVERVADDVRWFDDALECDPDE